MMNLVIRFLVIKYLKVILLLITSISINDNIGNFDNYKLNFLLNMTLQMIIFIQLMDIK